MNVIRIFILISLLLPMVSFSDIYIKVEATLIRPACVITSEAGEKELLVNFSNISPSNLAEAKQTFNIVISQCDLRNNLKIYLSPKEGGILHINNETVLATSTEGLGIRISQKNQNSAIDLLFWEQITPTINNLTGLISLQSELVTNKETEDLTIGPFTAALSIMVDYI